MNKKVSDKYEMLITVDEQHLDDLRHVNNVVYLQWVQEAAKAHWLSKSSDEFNAKYHWVVLDHFIEYKGAAFLGDEIRIETFVEKNEGVRSVRHVHFFRKDKLIVKAKTNWCLIDKERNRPARVPKEIDDLFFD